MRALNYQTLFLVAILGICGCESRAPTEPVEHIALISEADALQISNKAANDFGIDLAKWQVEGRPTLSDDQSEWLIRYHDGARYPPPGSGTLIAVDRKTGIAKLLPSE